MTQKKLKELKVMTMFEIIEAINDGQLTIEEASTSRGVVELLQYAFDPALKFQLPEGEPPFNKCPNPMGMTPANLRRETRVLYVFARPIIEDRQRIKRERSFIELLEAIHPKEAEMLIHVKDQTLTTMFPNVTLARMVEVGIVKATVQPEPVSEPEPVGKEEVLVQAEPTPEPEVVVTENQENPVGEPETPAEPEPKPAPKPRGRKSKAS